MQCNLTFAIAADGSTVHVSEVERGAACGYTCPGCGKALVARKGTEVQYHFAHADGEECKHGYRRMPGYMLTFPKRRYQNDSHSSGLVQ